MELEEEDSGVLGGSSSPDVEDFPSANFDDMGATVCANRNLEGVTCGDL